MNTSINTESTRHMSTLLAGVPHDQRWDILKTELQLLYHTQTIPNIVEHMKEKYDFKANVPAYKYRFKKWGWTKSIPASKRDEILSRALARAMVNETRTAATFDNFVVGPQRSSRHAGRPMPRSPLPLTGQELQTLRSSAASRDRLFSIWNLPSGPAQDHIQSSPSGEPASLSTNVLARAWPEADASPDETMSSPPTIAKNVSHHDRAFLFLQGRFDEMLLALQDNEKRTLLKWLHEFWFFCFKAAKVWSSADSLSSAESLYIFGHEPRSSQCASTTSQCRLPSDLSSSCYLAVDNRTSPPHLCNWSVHLERQEHASLETDSKSPKLDLLKDRTSLALYDILEASLASNSFTDITVDTVPLAVWHIIESIRVSKHILFEESLAFAIMSRNLCAVENLLWRSEDLNIDISKSFPVHIAASYLDGGKSCCAIFNALCHWGLERSSLRKMYTNSYGHTVLDNLMLTILKSHSAVLPGAVDDASQSWSRHTGIEVDSCGRWDADSLCFRSLATSGERTLPTSWKHKFCHTSVQAICHCIEILDGVDLLSTPSGLFSRSCSGCGTKLQLKPLHTLIMTGFHLATSGCQGEDLFGILACYLSLVSSGVDPLDEASVSVVSLLNRSRVSNCCDHESITPAKLLHMLTLFSGQDIPESGQVTWRILCKVSLLAERSRAKFVEMQEYHSKDLDGRLDFLYSLFGGKKSVASRCWKCRDREPAFGLDPRLSFIWAAVQAELLNYRRLSQDDPWLSDNFDLPALLDSLQTKDFPVIGYLQKRLVKQHCLCGKFTQWATACREDVSLAGYSNMIDPQRSSFIETTWDAAIRMDDIRVAR